MARAINSLPVPVSPVISTVVSAPATRSTSPSTRRGAWVFGAGIGALVVVIRLWGGLAEGVMYAILLMNALVPFINRATQPRVFGTRRGKGAEA